MTNTSRRAQDKPVTRRSGKKQGKKPKPQRTRGQKVRRFFLWVAALGLAGLLVGLIALVVLYQAIDIPDENEEFKSQTTFVYYDDGKAEAGKFARQNRVAVDLDEIPKTLQDAVVAAENKSFWTDAGIDPKGILRAAFSNAKAGQTVGGGSTITQQYVKILYLTTERSLERKVKEAIVSLKIQREMSKREVLEGYLNTIYFGRGAYGVQAASQAYFRKDVEDLSLRESAVLASVLNSPNALDPANGDDAEAELKQRFDYTLNRMAADGLATDGDVDVAKRKLPHFPKQKSKSTYGGQRGHMLKMVRDELLRLGYTDAQIDGGGLRVTTTVDKKMMSDLAASVREKRPDLPDSKLHVGAATVEPGTGALKAFFGGQDYLDSQINWAATGGMAGSTMKAFTVAAALENGYSLKNTFQGNSPYVFPGGGLKVYNAGEGRSDMGSSVSMITATANSTNTAFVDMSQSIPDGPKQIYRLARAAGIPPQERSEKFPGIPTRSVDFTPEDALVTLGKARVSPINMANAYATFANDGRRADVHVVTKVVDANGETWTRKAKTKRVIDSDVNADTVYALQQVVQQGSGRAALGLGRPAAGKTGTATAGANRDNVHVSSSWFVGFTPQYSTAVMYVRGDGDDPLDGWLPSFYGGSFPAQTWTAIMQKVEAGTTAERFPPPAWITSTRGSTSGGSGFPSSTQSADPADKDKKEKDKKPTKKPTETQSPSVPPTTAPTETPTPTLPPVEPTVPVDPTPPPVDPTPGATIPNGSAGG